MKDSNILLFFDKAICFFNVLDLCKAPIIDWEDFGLQFCLWWRVPNDALFNAFAIWYGAALSHTPDAEILAYFLLFPSKLIKHSHFWHYENKIHSILLIIKLNMSLKFPFQTCPLLLRVFCNTGRHHAMNEFIRGTPSNELQIYTWWVQICRLEGKKFQMPHFFLNFHSQDFTYLSHEKDILCQIYRFKHIWLSHYTTTYRF